jgi:tetratricopeptide (TPR) repeat protein
MFIIRTAAVALALSAALAAPVLRAEDGSNAADTPEREFQSAVASYQSSQFETAARQLEHLARRMPPSFQVEELLGLVYSAQKRDLQANRAFAKAVRLKPNSAAARANLAVNFARLGRTSQAEAEFKRAIEAGPGDYEANHDFGEFYAGQDKIAEAIPYLEKAQSVHPSSYDNGYDLALAYEKVGRFAQSRRQILRLLQMRRTAELYNLLADVEEKSGNYVAAANDYQKAAYMDPSQQNFFDWGGEFLLHHTWNAAFEVFSKGVERYPNSAPLMIGLGMALYGRGKYNSAVKALARATDIAPSDPHTYYFLSKAYRRAPGETSAVIDRFRRLEQLRPLDPRAAYYYAMSLWKGKEMEISGSDLVQVESLLEKAERLDPSFADAHLQLGNLYSQERQYAKAVPEYREALRLNPDRTDTYYRLGQAYVHLGERQAAAKEFELHQKLYRRHLAEDDQQREQIRMFVYSTREGQADPKPQ